MSARLYRWIWLGLLLLFCLCVFLKLNGSSVAYWSEVLNEPGKPPGLLFSTPKPVRADEWYVWTPAALSQARQTPAFPLENLSLGGGRAPLVMSVPVAYYTTFFRPQLWGFFLFDFERGFSFYWCLKIFALLLASAWFLRQLGIRRNGIVLLGTLWIFFSGFVQWWFSSPAMLPEMLATWMICTGSALRFFKETNPWRLALAFAAFVFCGINFVLCLYPPFQIPLLFLMIAILIGSCFELRSDGAPCWTKRGGLLSVAALGAVLLFLIPYWYDVRATLQIVAQTDYPGARRSTGGGLSLFQLLSGLTGFFQTAEIFPRAYDNICEASNFYPLWPAALVAVLVARWRRIAPVSPVIVALAVVTIGFSIYCLVPLPGWLLRATFLSFVTERRMVLTIGLANIFLCCVFLDRYRQQIFSMWGAISAGLFFWLAIVALFWTASLHKPEFFPDHRQLAIVVIANAAIFLFFWEKTGRWVLILFATLLILSNAAVNPVMRGLAPLIDSKAYHEVDQLRASDPTARWLVYHDFVLAQLVIATGAPTLNGNKTVPDLTFLRRFDPDGGGQSIYNRYAYINCEIPKKSQGPGVELLQHDCYNLYLPPELPILSELGCRFFVFTEPWPEAETHGFSLVKEIPSALIWIYQRRPPNG